MGEAASWAPISIRLVVDEDISRDYRNITTKAAARYLL